MGNKKINNMKTAVKLLMIPVLCASIVACNGDNDKARLAVNDLRSYVDSADVSSPEYTEDGWKTFNNEYESRASKIGDTSRLSEEDRTQLNTTRAKYTSYRTRYETELRTRTAAASAKQKMRNELFGEGRLGNDLSFSFVTADNLLATYTQFVDVVAKNKDAYSREDWDEIKMLYEALDNRKNEVEKDLASKDNIKIAQQKVRFSAIKSVNRPLAKAEENEAAKQ